MKISIDIHGTIDAKPEFFAKYTQRAIKNGHDVYICTGAMKTAEVVTQLMDLGIVWNYFFSISDYLIKEVKHVEFEDANNHWFDDEDWNRAKADFCEREGIEIHFDDSEVYEKYFENIPTRYVRMI
jgi:hypothetical protein